MNSDTLWYLKNLDIFEGVSDEEIMSIASEIEECQYPKDEMIYCPQDDLGRIFVVKRGEVRLYHSKEGKRTVFDVLGPGSLFGGIRLNSQKSTHFAQATLPTKVCIFKEKVFLDILRAKPEIMLRFMKKITTKMHEYEERLEQRSDSAREVVLKELLRLQDKRQDSLFGRFKKSSKVYITHEGLAELTGLNRVTVTRVLKSLKESGDLIIGRGGVELL
jgi:CRP-like cAMP-binding protein